MPAMVLGRWLAARRARRAARDTAEAACRALRPGEWIMGTWLCAEEADRYVVRVFCGRRGDTEVRMPPWRECVVFAVAKATFAANVIEDDEPYEPRLR